MYVQTTKIFNILLALWFNGLYFPRENEMPCAFFVRFIKTQVGHAHLELGMWVRRIGKMGTSWGVTLPVEALRALKWEQGDHVLVRMWDTGEVRITKFNPAQVPDRVREAIAPVSII